MNRCELSLCPLPQSVCPYLEGLIPTADAEAVTKAFHRLCEEETRSKSEQDNNDDGPGEELCNCEFSLAYGRLQGLETRMR